MAFSSTKLIRQLPDDAFSVVVVFHDCTLPGEEMDHIARKFSGRSKMISFAASPLSPSKQFDQQSSADVSANRSARECLENKSTMAAASEETFVKTYPTPKEEFQVEEMSSDADNPNTMNCSDMTVEELALEDDNAGNRSAEALEDDSASNRSDSKSEAQSHYLDASQVPVEPPLRKII